MIWIKKQTNKWGLLLVYWLAFWKMKRIRLFILEDGWCISHDVMLSWGDWLDHDVSSIRRRSVITCVEGFTWLRKTLLLMESSMNTYPRECYGFRYLAIESSAGVQLRDLEKRAGFENDFFCPWIFDSSMTENGRSLLSVFLLLPCNSLPISFYFVFLCMWSHNSLCNFSYKGGNALLWWTV